MFQVENNSNVDITDLTDIITQFMPFSQERLEFDQPVSLIFQSDDDNANKLLGKTAFYSPEELSVTVFVDGRHPKDILRSLSHELVHHAQNCRGDFDSADDCGPGYAQQNPHLRNMEIEAYKQGNLIFRDFEDLIKAGDISIEFSGEPTMSLKEWKDNELNKLLLEKWGYRKEDDKELEEAQSEKDREDESANQTGNQKVSMDDDMDLRNETITIAEAASLAARIFTKLNEEDIATGIVTPGGKHGYRARNMAKEKTFGFETGPDRAGIPQDELLKIAYATARDGNDVPVEMLADVDPAELSDDERLRVALYNSRSGLEERKISEGDRIQKLLSYLPGGPTPKEFRKVVARDKEDADAKKSEKRWGMGRLHRAAQIADEPQQESLSPKGMQEGADDAFAELDAEMAKKETPPPKPTTTTTTPTAEGPPSPPAKTPPPATTTPTAEGPPSRADAAFAEFDADHAAAKAKYGDNYNITTTSRTAKEGSKQEPSSVDETMIRELATRILKKLTETDELQELGDRRAGEGASPVHKDKTGGRFFNSPARRTRSTQQAHRDAGAKPEDSEDDWEE